MINKLLHLTEKSGQLGCLWLELAHKEGPYLKLPKVRSVRECIYVL